MADTQSSPQQAGWLRRRVRGIRHRPHFSTGVAIFLVLAVTLAGAGVEVARGTLYAFDAAALVFLITIGRHFSRASVAEMRTRAREQDGGRWGVLWSSVAVASVVPIALGVELHAASTGHTFEIVLAGASLLLSWVFLNTMFAIHYAHEFYSAHEDADPILQFPETRQPDYWDFVYFAFVLGMTFQVSDVAIASRSVRRIALAHGFIGFVFNVVIVALSVNIVAGRF